jgi:hypothetical protein
LNNSNNPDDSKQQLNDSTVSQSSIALKASKKESPKTSSQLPISLAQTFAKKGLSRSSSLVNRTQAILEKASKVAIILTN